MSFPLRAWAHPRCSEGKSTLMNTLLGKSNVFKVSHRSETCTQGIHVSTTLPKWSTFAGDAWTSRSREPVVALIDSEGGGCKGEAYDMQVRRWAGEAARTLLPVPRPVARCRSLAAGTS